MVPPTGSGTSGGIWPTVFVFIGVWRARAPALWYNRVYGNVERSSLLLQPALRCNIGQKPSGGFRPRKPDTVGGFRPRIRSQGDVTSWLRMTTTCGGAGASACDESQHPAVTQLLGAQLLAVSLETRLYYNAQFGWPPHGWYGCRVACRNIRAFTAFTSLATDFSLF